MKPTKRPWKQLEHDPNWITNGKRLIAMISDSNGDRNITAQTMANAALIAAAPDMLEALELALEELNRINKAKGIDAESYEPNCVSQLAIGLAEQAIIKAKGK